MSLLHRVSSTESISGSSSIPYESSRRLSFSPVSEWIPPRKEEEAVGAYEVSKWSRIGESLPMILFLLLMTVMLRSL